MPPYKLRGDQAVLECHYELEGDSLYAVKWYKENEEFFRYVPKSNPPLFSYKLEGVKVDVSEINFSRRVFSASRARASARHHRRRQRRQKNTVFKH